ncbi:putative ATP-dependent helicase IRC3 [Exophiala xenobiotica]|nr:putative ATP-dependent helicase IRC3 [Exophiala xenobiotica]
MAEQNHTFSKMRPASSNCPSNTRERRQPFSARGHKRLGISLATGSGKTVIFTQLIDRVSPPSRDAQQTLILAHRRELVEQAARHCERAYPSKSIEIEMGETRATGAADITIASKRVRGERLEAFKKREFPVLLNCGVFTEGTDMPNIDCVLLARPTKSRNLLVQMIGRGMRLYPDKKDCHVIDMVASLETGIVTVPTLFGLDPSEMVKGARLDDMKDLKNQPNKEAGASVSQLAPGLRPDITGDHRLDFTHYDSVHDLIEDTSGERHVRAMSPNAWVQVDSQKYILAAKGGVLTLESRLSPSGGSEPQFAVVWKHSLPMMEGSKSPWSRPRVVATASTLSDALHAADTFASNKFDRNFIATSTSWRKTPASEGQLTFLNRMRDVSEDDVEPLTTNDITKGQAGDMITKIKFGARGRFDALQVKTRKVEREMEKQRKITEMRERETVRVGPLKA